MRLYSLIFGLFLLCVSSCAITPVIAQPDTRLQALSLWQPITRERINRDVARYRDDGLVLDTLLERSLMYRQANPFLDAVRNELDKTPNNSTLLATYARSLSIMRASYLWNSKLVPGKYGSQHNFDTKYISSLIEQAMKASPKPWLAYVAAGEFGVQTGIGSVNGISVRRVAAMQKAVDIERNPLTLTSLAIAFIIEESGVYVEPGQVYKTNGETQRAIDILIRVKQQYPWYWHSTIALWQAYTYRPLVKDEVKADKAYQDVLNMIPSNLTATKPIQRYLKWAHYDQRD